MASLYTQGQFIDFCDTVFKSKRSSSGKGNIAVTCPFCKKLKGDRYFKQKLAIHVESHVLHCWVCHYKSRSLVHVLKSCFPNHLQTYLNKFANKEQILFYENNQKKEMERTVKHVSIPKGFTLLATANDADSHVMRAKNYLKGRGVLSDSMLWYWRMGITKATEGLEDRIIIPSLNKDGILDYYSARTIKKRTTGRKYENPEVVREDIIFNEINIDWTKELTLVEGVFDLLKCNSNATTLLGSELPGHFRLFQKIVENKTPIVLALDPEAVSSSYRIAKSLLKFDVPVRILFLKPGQEDVGSISNLEFNELLNDAKIFSMDYYLRMKIDNLV